MTLLVYFVILAVVNAGLYGVTDLRLNLIAALICAAAVIAQATHLQKRARPVPCYCRTVGTREDPCVGPGGEA